jgi:predicted regulator of Ras-like GTPase activity (Roadblock/LC7/MglB family)
MFGFLKNLLRKSPETSAENYQDTASEPAAAAAQEAAPKAPVFRAPPLRRNAPAPNGHSKGIEISLHAIIQGLPLELQPRVRRTDVGDLSLTVPLEKVLAQLSRGAVKVSFGELRQAAPDVFTAQNDRDRVLVSLPLADILAKLNPALIARRRVQRQVQVPADISSPFDSNGEGLAFPGSTAKAEPEPTPVPQRQVAAPPSHAVSPARTSITAVNSPAPAELTATAHAAPRFNTAKTPIAPPTPKPVPAAASAVTPQAAALHAALPKPAAAQQAAPARPAVPFNPNPTFVKPVSPIDPGPVTANPAIPSAVLTPAPKHAAPAVVTPSAPAPVAATPSTPTAPGGEPLIVGLASIAEAWPDEVRKEIISLGLAEAKVGLPASAIEQALKQGRICFSWKTLRAWVKPTPSGGASSQDSVVLDLPLKVVAPLFLERQREAAKSKQKVSIDEDIPNLFFGFPQPEGTPSPATATARSTDTNYYVWEDSHDTARIHESEVKRPSPGTKFVAKYATPNEVVSRAAGLEGVVGALIALPDGLMVANRLPPDLNADTLAAFLPQIFGKVSMCTKELRMGELNNLNFTVGNVPWKIFRVNAIFFAAFGQAGMPLPTSQLAALAGELDHKQK